MNLDDAYGLDSGYLLAHDDAYINFLTPNIFHCDHLGQIYMIN